MSKFDATSGPLELPPRTQERPACQGDGACKRLVQAAPRTGHWGTGGLHNYMMEEPSEAEQAGAIPTRPGENLFVDSHREQELFHAARMHEIQQHVRGPPRQGEDSSSSSFSRVSKNFNFINFKLRF